ncbi:MAG: right-handed parallel beta-helix repeat-containing protein [Planctomycetes bacterium]|nr:right-handed parallel beta-helix repeat-containing protein [Planctomycetota bacterium]
MKRTLVGTSIALLALLTPALSAAEDFYVSAATGKGQKGTKEEPAKDIGNIDDKLKPGDTVNMAGGVYLGKAESGRDELLVPVKIIGGWDDAFTKRDPWGAMKTVLSGRNTSKNFQKEARLEIDLQKYKGEPAEIVVDGIIVDNAGRNRYAGDGDKVLRKADPKTGENASPETAGIRVQAGKGCTVRVENCVVLNCAPTTGALAVWGAQGSKAVVRNNLVVNNTGNGIDANTIWHPRDGREMSESTIENNTVLFTWKHDPYETFGGYALSVDADTVLTIRHNTFAFSDICGFYNAKKAKGVTLAENLFKGNLQADMIEFNTKLDGAKFEDDAELLTDTSTGNVFEEFTVEMPKAWATKYASRTLIDRNAAEADVKMVESRANEWRKMLGLPLEGTD